MRCVIASSTSGGTAATDAASTAALERAAKAIASEIGLTPDVVAGQLKQGIYLTPDELTSAEWLGTEAAPGKIAENLESASQFLAEQKQIPAAAPLKTFQDAIYTKGLPDALKQ